MCAHERAYAYYLDTARRAARESINLDPRSRALVLWRCCEPKGKRKEEEGKRKELRGIRKNKPRNRGRNE
jgi:hypothetical protein